MSLEYSRHNTKHIYAGTLKIPGYLIGSNAASVLTLTVLPIGQNCYKVGNICVMSLPGRSNLCLILKVE